MEIDPKARALYDRLANGWNTWDVRSVTAHVKLPEKLRLHVSLVVPHMSGYSGDMLWENVESFGEHSADGSYTDVLIRFLDGLYKIESAADGDALVIKVTPVRPRYNTYVLLEIGPAWGSRLNTAYEGDGIRVSGTGKGFFIDSPAKPVFDVWNPSKTASLMVSGETPVYFRVNSTQSADAIDRKLQEARAAWLRQTITADGMLGEGLDALRRSLLWNTVYDPRNGRVITPVSRNWCRGNGHGFGDYVLFGWDTFFAALQLGLISKELAYAAMFSILEEITPEGMIPNFGCANGSSRDRSEPQVGALCAWKLYVQFGDRWFIEACFDRLLRWNAWRFENRDFLKDGLLELASTPWEAEPHEEIWSRHNAAYVKLGASLESGIDNSPMWDKVAFNREHHCHELYFHGLCCEMVFDCTMLEKMAALLGREDDRAALAARRERLAALINTHLWDESRGFYMNKHWSGDFDPCVSLTGFYALTAGVADADKVRRMVDAYLLDDTQFWGEYVLPNVSRQDPAFGDQDYWRGRIWAPTNFIVGEGLMRAGLNEVWRELAQKGLALFVKCWRAKGTVGENYNAITGESAEPDKASDRFYHWGALLVYMAVEQAINFNEWNDTVERQSVPDWTGSAVIRNVPVGETRVTLA